jgi:glycosyltransferase involved in cell wall biosynthesis
MNGKDKYILVIPAYNESTTIREVVQGALRHLDTVIVVDDGSSDGTAERLSNLPVILLHHPENSGKAASLWHGMQVALNLGAKGIVTMDGDRQHDPNDIPRLIKAAEIHPDRLVIGSRLWNHEIIPKIRYRANRFANFWIAWASGQAMEDSQSGFRVYPAQLIRLCRFELSRDQSFVFESEIIIEAARHGFLCTFLPVQTTYSKNARPSHFRPVKDIARITRMVAWQLTISGLFLPGLWRSLSGVIHGSNDSATLEGPQ